MQQNPKLKTPKNPFLNLHWRSARGHGAVAVLQKGGGPANAQSNRRHNFLFRFHFRRTMDCARDLPVRGLPGYHGHPLFHGQLYQQLRPR